MQCHKRGHTWENKHIRIFLGIALRIVAHAAELTAKRIMADEMRE